MKNYQVIPTSSAYKKVRADLTMLPALSFIEYTGNGYTYWCEAAITTAKSAELWRVLRKEDATNTMLYAGVGDFNHAATDLSAVTALTYTLGA